ncbi:hypothetical protein MMC24_003798 [Lignoscripta atroalba]|nr:hypothetical protein [Lignoscripta atroalba]
MFSTAQGKPHSVRKRMISNVYSKSYLQSSPDMHSISQMLLFGRLLPLVEDLVLTDTPVDVHELNFAVTMDFINAYIFGLSNGSNFLQDVKIREHWLDLYQSRKAHTFWPQELPKLKSVLHSIGITVVPPWVDSANREIEAWCLKMCEAAELSYCSGNSKSDSLPQGVVFDQLRQSMEKPSVMSGVPYPKQLTIASELLDHLAAGHETSGITLTYLIHELSQRPHLQASLRDEVRTLTPSLYYKPKLDPESSVSELAELPSSRAVDALPLLHAVLMETLRRHAAIPGPQPRTTPHNLSAPVTLGGYSNIPSDVRVSALAWTLHRNEEVFPEPETWKPERWFDASTEVKDEMMRWFWAFGSGGRMCIGSHFAIQEMKLVVAAVYANYKTSIIDDEGIEQADMYTAGPKGNKLIIKFERH